MKSGLAAAGLVAVSSVGLLSAPAQAESMQCTELVCLFVTGGPDGYATHAYKRSSAAGASTFEGFFAFSGPGLHADTETKRWYDFENTSTFGGRGAGLVCVQMMYKHPDGSFGYGSQRCDRVY
ncbi:MULTISPECIES: hypothetical protein [Streptomycetaceae]|uniref:hypothetical protein n=2 Tax=Kitasatosporales TaxID=85011 RepID=UPI000938AD91|nr:hypothetical protein [Streptomyces sp. CB02056]OKI05694.1 hypothetical protein AMK13_20455 [Streptomyces sp. CB02056]